MQELRFVAVSEDGSYAVLAVPGRSGRFTLPIDDRLRAVARGQPSRLAQYEIEVESPLRPKEIQARIRAGETVEEIADAAGIAVDRVRWFEGPVLAERAYVADQARAAAVRRQNDSAPGARLGDIVAERLNGLGADPEDARWDSRKRGDNTWLVQLAFSSGGRLHAAEWIFDPRRRHAIPADDNAARLSLPEADLPAPIARAQATVTSIGPRLSATQAPESKIAPEPVHFPEPLRAPAPEPQRALAPEPLVAQAPEPVQVPEPVRAPAPQPQRAPSPEPVVARAPEPVQAPEPVRAPSPEPLRAPMPEPVVAQAPAPVYVPEPVVATPVPASPPPTASVPAASVPAAQVAAAQAPEPVVAQAPAQPEPELAAAPEAVAATEPEAPEPPRGRPGKKNSARGRRSAVPSWDEIMIGNSRQRD
jgi:hypothetical protein